MTVFSAIALIVRRSLRQHALSTAITATSVAMGCGLLMAVVGIRTQSFDAFTAGTTGFDAVAGPRGSQLQLVLNSVFHLEQATGKMSWQRYQDLAKDRRVMQAVPYAVGDNYRGFRIIGTLAELFTDHEYAPGRSFEFESSGRVFDAQRAEAVVGSHVALQAGLKLGSSFHTYHGVSFDASQRHDLAFKVVGVLKPTNTPVDRAIWIPLEGYYRMPGHPLYGSGEKFEAKPGEPIPDEVKEVSAVMLKIRPGAGFTLSNDINMFSKDLTLAWPIGQVMASLFDKVAWVNHVLSLVAVMVVIVAAGSILASVYNTMNERRRQFAILRALGAGRGVVSAVIVLESAAIALLGALGGFVVYGLLLSATATVIRQKTGVVLEVFRFDAVLIWAPLGVIVLGAFAGLFPAMKAYRTDVASHLLPTT